MASSSLFVVFVVVIGGLLFRVSGENILLENEMAPRNYVLVLLG